MKRCDDYSATIQLYLDRELSGQGLEEFRVHLEECEACQTDA
jgi:anti-sigma factor RsiW